MSKNHRRPPLHFQIEGTHCASCEVVIERRLKKIPGIDRAKVNHATGQTEIHYHRKPSWSELQEALAGTEYSLQQPDLPQTRNRHTTTRSDYKSAGYTIAALLAIYWVLRQLNLIPEGLGVTENMSYGFVFIIGLVAAVSSCIAVTGGLLVAAAGRYAEAHPNVSGIRRFRPHLYFNIGRVVGYTLLGGLVGAAGSLFTLSTRLTGVLTIAASLVMIFLGCQLLNIFPGLRRFHPKMPKGLAHRVHEASSSSDHPVAPFLLGGATFFLPCGFTQALQLYVLAQGSFTVGALTMLAFSLGTLPALLSLSALSSFLKGEAQKKFFRVAGAVVVLLGLANIRNGLALANINLNLGQLLAPGQTVTAEAAPIVDGKQLISMKVNGLHYEPAQFTVQQGVPVEWRIDGSNAAGCASVILAPDLDLTISLPSSGEKVVTFTPEKTGKFSFNCPMGMATRSAAITVVSSGGSAQSSRSAGEEAPSTNPDTQRFKMAVTYNEGFTPTEFTAQAGRPVELEIDVQTPLGGCMSTVISSEYDVAKTLKRGKNFIKFTPTKPGKVYLTCPMGVYIGEFNITN